MTITAQHVNREGTRVFMGAITGGEDIHQAIESLAAHHHITAAAVEMLGGLSRVEFTAYDFERQQRLPPLVFERALEIVAGQGTISLLEGAPRLHLHLVAAFRDPSAAHGITTVGGHVAGASAFAVEFILTAYDGVAVHRSHDPATGLKLWHLPPFLAP